VLGLIEELILSDGLAVGLIEELGLPEELLLGELDGVDEIVLDGLALGESDAL